MAVSIRELARVILPGGTGVIGMLAAYFDHTGTHDGSKVVAVAGLLADLDNWSIFEDQWREKLTAPLPGKPALRRFHMTDCMAGQAEFRGYTNGERDAVIHDFRQLILRSNCYGYCCAVLVDEWERQMPLPKISGISGPQIFAIGDCVHRMWQMARGTTFHDAISLVVDRRDEVNNALDGHFIDLAREEIPSGLTVLGPSFMPSMDVLPLQAADMFAWEVRNWAEANEGVRPHAKPFERLGFEVRFFGVLAISQMAASVKDVDG